MTIDYETRGSTLCVRRVMTDKRLGHYRVGIFRLALVVDLDPGLGVPGTPVSNPEPY